MRSALAALAAAYALPAAAAHVPPLSDALGLVRRTTGSGVALTFDDGPHPEGTVAVLDALAAAAAKATFFLVGEQVVRSPALARELVAAGHDVALHGYRHRNLLGLTPRALAEDLDRAYATIAEHTGVAPRAHRAPYGIYSWAALAAVRARGWTPTLWSLWGRDWRRRATPEGIAQTVTRRLGAGDILLLHDADDYSAPGSHRRTAAALPRVLETIAAAGLELQGL